MALEIDRRSAEERFRTVFAYLGAITAYARRPARSRRRATGRPVSTRRGGNMNTDPTILRLRTANPCPLPATVDAADLFARITERPPDSRLRGRATPRRRRALVAAVSFAVMA